MSEPGLRIGGSDCLEGSLERCVKRVAGARAGLAQGSFELGPALLDRIELGRIRGQRLQPCPSARNELGDACHFVHRQVVQHHDVARFKGRPQHPFGPGAEDLSVDCSLHPVIGALTPVTPMAASNETFGPNPFRLTVLGLVSSLV